MILDIEEIYKVGEDTFIDSVAANNQYAVTFEDNEETGYFYALENGEQEFEIVDALHIYNVENVVDKEKPSKIQIVWNDEYDIASLLINDYCHAIFDFKRKAGYCRNGFPENKGTWSKIENRILSDENIENLFK